MSADTMPEDPFEDKLPTPGEAEKVPIETPIEVVAPGTEQAPLEIPDEVREAIIGEFLEEAAFEDFKQARPDLWMQVKRLNRVLELQDDTEEQCFQSGICFIHTNTPDYQGFCVKRIIEIDLESCMVVVEIHGEEELRPGVVMLPLETVSWFGFPAEKVAMDMSFRGFTFGQKGPQANKTPGTSRIVKSFADANETSP